MSRKILLASTRRVGYYWFYAKEKKRGKREPECATLNT